MQRAAAFAIGAIACVGCIKKESVEPSAVPLEAGPAVAPNVPFASHPQSYADGSILPSGAPASLDQAARDFYDGWRERYMKQGCGEGHYFVKMKAGTATVSEAQGYGMMLAALMAGHDPHAKTYFDGMLRYFRAHQSRLQPGLMAWHQNDACEDTKGPNSATDGDLDIAYALLLADKQWGSCGTVDYLANARWVIDAIRRRDIDPTGRYTLLGDWVEQNNQKHFDGTRISDFMTGHFRSYGAVTGDPTWTSLVDHLYWITETLQTQHAPTTGLVPDFAQGVLHDKPRPASPGFLEGDRDGWYSYNACRVPWRIGTDFLVSGDERAKRIAQRLNHFAATQSGGDPTKIMAVYDLEGNAKNDYETMAFTAPFGVSAMVDASSQAWLDALWRHISTREAEKYYEDSIRALSMIVMSGNWWVPERVADPCDG